MNRRCLPALQRVENRGSSAFVIGRRFNRHIGGMRSHPTQPPLMVAPLKIGKLEPMSRGYHHDPFVRPELPAARQFQQHGQRYPGMRTVEQGRSHLPGADASANSSSPACSTILSKV